MCSLGQKAVVLACVFLRLIHFFKSVILNFHFVKFNQTKGVNKCGVCFNLYPLSIYKLLFHKIQGWFKQMM